MNNFLIIQSNIMNLKGFKKPGEVYKFLGIKRGTYYTWKNRNKIPPKEVMWIADKLNVPVKILIQNEDKIPEKDFRIEDILNLLKDDPDGMEAVFHFLQAKKNFDRASKAMKQYLGKKLETWFEFPGGNNDKGKEDG